MNRALAGVGHPGTYRNVGVLRVRFLAVRSVDSGFTCTRPRQEDMLNIVQCQH